MVSRRAFLSAAAPAVLALGGCSSSFKENFSSFASSAFHDINTVAAYLEQLVKQVVAKAMTAADAAAAFVAAGADYVVPGLRLFASVVKLAGQVSAASPQLSGNVKFQSVLGQANTLVANPAVQAAVTTGALPSDPVTVLTGVIDLAAQIYTLTQGKASPTSAAATV